MSIHDGDGLTFVVGGEMKKKREELTVNHNRLPKICLVPVTMEMWYISFVHRYHPNGAGSGQRLGKSEDIGECSCLKGSGHFNGKHHEGSTDVHRKARR